MTTLARYVAPALGLGFGDSPRMGERNEDRGGLPLSFGEVGVFFAGKREPGVLGLDVLGDRCTDLPLSFVGLCGVVFLNADRGEEGLAGDDFEMLVFNLGSPANLLEGDPGLLFGGGVPSFGFFVALSPPALASLVERPCFPRWVLEPTGVWGAPPPGEAGGNLDEPATGEEGPLTGDPPGEVNGV